MSLAGPTRTKLWLWGFNSVLFGILLVLLIVVTVGTYLQTGSFSSVNTNAALGFYGVVAFAAAFFAVSVRRFLIVKRELEILGGS